MSELYSERSEHSERSKESFSESKNERTKDFTDAELFADSLLNLKQAVLNQSASQRRVAVRVKFLIRSILGAVIVSLVFTLYLIYILAHQVETLTKKLDLMSAEGQHVLTSMNNIDAVMNKFDTQMKTLPYINESVTNIDKYLSLVTTNVGGVSDSFDTINTEVNELSKEMESVSLNVEALGATVHRLNKDIHEVTKPVKRFNDFNPFNF